MVKPRKRKNETKEEFLHRACNEYYTNGLTICEIAKKLNLSYTQVFNYCCNREYFVSDMVEMIRILKEDKGLNYTEIGRHLGISRTTARRKYKNGNKFDRYINGNILTTSQVDKIYNLFVLHNWTVPMIAKELNLTNGCVRYRLKKMGLKPRRKNPLVTTSEKAKFKLLKEQGYSIIQIAKITGRSRNSVSKYL